jgi:protein TonB
MPQFEGGVQAMYRFLRRHLRYPRADQSIGLEGTVFVRFIIDVTGTVTGVEVIRGASGSLDKEAMRVISLMPKWKPGSQHGMPVNVRMVLPIKFELGKD